MNVPGWWGALLLAAAAWRTFHLLAYDSILDRPRRYVTGLAADAKYRDDGREKLIDFIECPFCLGFWTVLAWWAAWQVWPQGTLVIAVPFALSAGVVGAQKILGSDS